MLAPFPDRLGSSHMEMLQFEKKMELHNMEKLEHPGGAPFQLRVSWIPSYSSRSTKIYGAPSSGIFNDKFKSLDPPNAFLCSAKTALRRRCGFTPTRRLERGTFQKRNPSSSRGRRRSTLMGKGPRCELCCVFVVALGHVVGTAEAVGEAV